MRYICPGIVFLLCTVLAQAQQKEVVVGGYEFPPFVELTSGGEWSGITLSLLAELNALQDEFHFVFHPTSSGRRYSDLLEGRYQMIFFENPQWGWPTEKVEAIKGLVLGQEVFIARQLPGRDQTYFADHENKRIALFSGYHYAFAGFVNNKQYLRHRHNAVFTQSQESNVQMVLRGRVELALVTQAWLENYLQRYPHYRSQLLVADEPDQLYQHFLLLRHDSNPELSVMQDLLMALKAKGALERVLVEHGVNAVAD